MKRVLVIIALIALTSMVGGVGYYVSSSRNSGRFDAGKLVNAITAYAASLKAERLPVPATVSLQELVKRRFLTADDAREFSGMDVTINMSATGERPQDILVRVRLAGGEEFVVLADGSVQRISATRLK